MSMATEFTRPSSSALLTLGAGGSWEETDIANPSVLFDTPNNRWALVYNGYSVTSGKWSTGVAFASALTGPYTKSSFNPVMSPGGGDGNIVGNGAVVLKGSTYYHFFGNGSQDLTTIPPQMLLATASDLEGTWTRQNSGSPVLTLGAAGSFEAGGITDMSVSLMADGVTFECVYAGFASVATLGARVIGRATSTDGITWTKQGTFAPRVPAYLANYYGEPALLRDPNDSSKLALFYDEALADGFRTVGRACSRDGGATWGWRHQALGPSGGGYESVQVFDPCPVLYQGRVHLFHAGAPAAGPTENLGAEIGYAVADYYPGVA